jgi:8-oxo-dGTP pyrophosphatase MutT (NUDIX family)
MPISDFLRGVRAKVGHDLLLLPGVSALVVNDAGEVLLHKSSDTGRWHIIGGVCDPGEDPADAVVREVLEETGVRCVPTRITGVYTTPTVVYPNGDQVIYTITQFLCRATGGEPHVADDESLEVRYFAAGALPEMREDILVRLKHAMAGDGGAAQFRFRGEWVGGGS